MVDPDHGQRQRTADVVLYWMRRRGTTRQLFADRMGKSLSWVDKIRAGDRQLDRLSVLRRIAEVLDIPLAVLIDPDETERRRACPDDREIDAVRDALRRYDAMTNVFRPDGDALPVPDLPTLERMVRYGWMAFQAVNYQTVGQLLAVWQLDGDGRRSAQAWLCWSTSSRRRPRSNSVTPSSAGWPPIARSRSPNRPGTGRSSAMPRCGSRMH